jgi:hypothetical protein
MSGACAAQPGPAQDFVAIRDLSVEFSACSSRKLNPALLGSESLLIFGCRAQKLHPGSFS